MERGGRHGARRASWSAAGVMERGARHTVASHLVWTVSLHMLYLSWRSSFFLRQAHMPKDEPQGEIVYGFERPGQDEWQPNQEEGVLEEQAGEDWADGRAHTAGQGGDTGRRGALFRGDQCHCIGLPGGYVHLRKDLAQQQERRGDGKCRRDGHQEQEDIGG